MITTTEATHIIHQNPFSLKECSVPLCDSLGLILSEDIVSDRNIPPFDRVTMDGIAIQLNTYLKGQPSFMCEHISRAGDPQYSLQDQSRCVQVMTGGVLPKHTNCVIPYEMTEEKDNVFHLSQTLPLKTNLNVHTESSDAKQGDLLIQRNTLVKPPHIGVMASVGKSYVRVLKKPRIVILSTGDELVDISESPLPHQIRKSNVHIVFTILTNLGYPCRMSHLNDNSHAIQSALSPYVTDTDILILSGGISKGKFDLIPKSLEDMGMKTLFHRIAQRPGKPMLFGVFENTSVPVFGLPGNPVSTLVCFYRYVLPYLKSLERHTVTPTYMTLGEDFEFKKPLTCFLPVALKYNSLKNQPLAMPSKHHGSGDYVSLCASDGFLELPESLSHFKTGDSFPYYTWA